VSGTGAQAKTKDICVFASGARADFERAHGLLAEVSGGLPMFYTLEAL